MGYKKQTNGYELSIGLIFGPILGLIFGERHSGQTVRDPTAEKSPAYSGQGRDEGSAWHAPDFGVIIA
jgi:hypothetical protein